MHGTVSERKKNERQKNWDSNKEMKSERGGKKGRGREANKEQSNSME